MQIIKNKIAFRKQWYSKVSTYTNLVKTFPVNNLVIILNIKEIATYTTMTLTALKNLSLSLCLCVCAKAHVFARSCVRERYHQTAVTLAYIILEKMLSGNNLIKTFTRLLTKFFIRRKCYSPSLEPMFQVVKESFLHHVCDLVSFKGRSHEDHGSH